MGLGPKGQPKQERSPSGLNGQLELAKIPGLERATRVLNRDPQDSNVSEDVLWLSRSRRLNGCWFFPAKTQPHGVGATSRSLRSLLISSWCWSSRDNLVTSAPFWILAL